MTIGHLMIKNKWRCKQLTSKTAINKRKKESSLYFAAYYLFTTKGINNTAISDIVKEAGVAKGTFYLYFKDKYDILNKIVLNKSIKVLNSAIKETKVKNFDSFSDKILFFIDYIIRFFENEQLMLKLIHKNLSWGVYRKAREEYEEMSELYSMFENHYKDTDIKRDDVEKLLFMIVDLVGSVCYSSIILNQPASIDEMRPILFSTIKKII